MGVFTGLQEPVNCTDWLLAPVIVPFSLYQLPFITRATYCSTLKMEAAGIFETLVPVY